MERAMELIPELESLKKAKKILSETDCRMYVVKGDSLENLPNTLRLNILGVVNCEYEKVRKEVSEL